MYSVSLLLYIYTLLLVISLLSLLWGARWDHDQSESRETTGSAAESVRAGQ